MQEVPMRPLASSIDKPMLFQIRDELSNLARHNKLASKKQLQSNAKFPKVRPSACALVDLLPTGLTGRRGDRSTIRAIRGIRRCLLLRNSCLFVSIRALKEPA